MCGRYTQTADARTLAGRFRLAKLGVDVRPRWNMAPGQEGPVVFVESGRRLGLYRWGLIPAWAKDPTIGSKMGNARAETAADKPAFRGPFQRRRCLVPADGFYEWRKAGKAKIPVRFTRLDGAPFAFAGLWDEWTSTEGSVVRSYSVLTTEPNPLVAAVHDRMPVMLTEAGEDAWLDPGAKTAELRTLLVPYDAAGMRAQDASTRVNAARNDDPSLLVADEPLQPELGL